jgi:hypothetical protein
MYKTDVVDMAVEGLRTGGITYPEVFRVLLERVYDCGYNEAVRAEDTRSRSFHTFPGCRVCGIGADGKVMGYVCNRSDCPTKVTC